MLWEGIVLEFDPEEPVFWMVLVVVGVLVWNFSTRFQPSQKAVTVQRVHVAGRLRPGRQRHHHRQRDHRHLARASENFRTYAPAQYEGLANQLIESKVVVSAREADGEPVGGAAAIRGRRSCC